MHMRKEESIDIWIEMQGYPRREENEDEKKRGKSGQGSKNGDRDGRETKKIVPAGCKRYKNNRCRVHTSSSERHSDSYLYKPCYKVWCITRIP